MKYTAFISIPTKIEVEASSPKEAEELIAKQLINSGQIKPADYIEINIAEEMEIK